MKITKAFRKVDVETFAPYIDVSLRLDLIPTEDDKNNEESMDKFYKEAGKFFYEELQRELNTDYNDYSIPVSTRVDSIVKEFKEKQKNEIKEWYGISVLSCPIYDKEYLQKIIEQLKGLGYSVKAGQRCIDINTHEPKIYILISNSVERE